jgi:hypothetical protein
MNPLMEQYAQYNTQYPDTEVIGGLLYDTLAFTTANTTILTFFTAGARATLDLTNMKLQGQLPAPSAFLVRAFRFYVRQEPYVSARAATGNVNAGCTKNVAFLVNTGVFRFSVSSKAYFECPLWMVPSGGGIFPMFSVDGNTADPGTIVDIATNGMPSINNTMSLSQPLFIAPQIDFKVELLWPAGTVVIAPSPLNICVVLDGELMRPVQ